MTNKYTEDEIRKATIDAVGPVAPGCGIAADYLANKIMDELTKPKQSFREGEVVFCGHGMYYHRPMKGGEKPCPKCRRLTYNELPQYVHDFVDSVASTGMCSLALGKFNAASGRGEG